MNVPPTLPSRLKALLWFGAATIWLGLILVPLANAWEFAPDLRHGWSAPILIGYLWWERLRDRPRLGAVGTRFHRSHLAVILPIVALIIPLRLTLIPFPLWPSAIWLYSGALIVLGLYVVWLKAGWSTAREIGSPLLILIGVVPWPGVIERKLILPLREGITPLIAECSNLLGAPALAIGTSVVGGTALAGYSPAARSWASTIAVRWGKYCVRSRWRSVSKCWSTVYSR